MKTAFLPRWTVIVLSLAIAAGCSAPAKLVLKLESPVNPWTHLKLKNDPDNFHFAVVTDRTGGARRGVFESAVKKLNLLQPEFVMSVGDLIGGYTENEREIDRQWEEFDGFVEALDMPFFYVPGNHDITNEVMAGKWKERHGRSYFHFVYRGVLFLCLNSQDPPHHQLGDEQIAYMAKALSDNPGVRWTLVFLHGPLWTYSPDTNGWAKLEALLRDRPYTAFAGHEHAYTKYVRNDMRHFVLATTGGGSALRGPLFGEFDHVAWITMTSDGPLIANLLLEGIRDENIRTEEVKAFMDRFASGAFIEPTPIPVDGSVFHQAAFQLRLTNDADAPMRLEINLDTHDKLRAAPRTLNVTLPPNAVETRNVRVRAAKPVAVSRLKPYRLEWVAEFESDGDLPVRIEGETMVSRRGVVEDFFGIEDWFSYQSDGAKIGMTAGAGRGPGALEVDVQAPGIWGVVHTVDRKLTGNPAEFAGLVVGVRGTEGLPVNVALVEASVDGKASDGEYWTTTLVMTEDWMTVRIPFSDFKPFESWQPAGADKNGEFNLDNLAWVKIINSDTSSTGRLLIDEIRFYGREGAGTR